MKEFEKYYPGPYIFDDSIGWIIGTSGDGTYMHCFDWEDSSFTNKYEPTEIQKIWLRKINGEDIVLPSKHKFTASDIRKAIGVYETVCKNNIELLEEADAMAEQEAENVTTIPSTTQPSNDMTLELVQKMVDWDRRKRILEDWKWNVMNDVVQGRKPFTDRMKYAFYLNLEKLKKHGFEG